MEAVVERKPVEPEAAADRRVPTRPFRAGRPMPGLPPMPPHQNSPASGCAAPTTANAPSAHRSASPADAASHFTTRVGAAMRTATAAAGSAAAVTPAIRPPPAAASARLICADEFLIREPRLGTEPHVHRHGGRHGRGGESRRLQDHGLGTGGSRIAELGLVAVHFLDRAVLVE